MPATTTRRSAERSYLVTALLILGLAGLWIGPMGCGGDAEDASTQKTASQNSSNRSVLLNVGFVDQTTERAPTEQFLIETPKSARWTPGALEGGFTTKAFKKYPVGETHKLLLYPEGENGPRLTVPFTMKSDMSSVLAGSRTNITVYDDSIVVAGPAVPDERMVFDRPPSSSDAP
jgi:hypothetical protein